MMGAWGYLCAPISYPSFSSPGGWLSDSCFWPPGPMPQHDAAHDTGREVAPLMRQQDLPHLSTMWPREDIKNRGVYLRIAPAGEDASKLDHKQEVGIMHSIYCAKVGGHSNPVIVILPKGGGGV